MEDSETQLHLSLMREALAMANTALLTSETPVGCILYHVPTSSIIGRGMNATNRSYNGTRHAEFIAVNEVLTTLSDLEDPETLEDSTDTASRSDSDKPNLNVNPSVSPSNQGEAEVKQPKNNPRETSKSKSDSRYKYTPQTLKQCDLYVTVEPCIMCASLLRQFGIRRVFFGASNEKFGGTGGVLNLQRGNGRVVADGGEVVVGKDGDGHGLGREGDYEVSGGWLREEAILLLRRFYVQENERAPEPRGKEGRVLKLVVEPLGEGRGA